MTSRQQFKYRHVDKWWFATAYFMISFFAKRGFLDGRSGLVFASLKREYYSHIRLKILEMRKNKQAPDIDSSSSEAVRSPMDRDIPVTLIIPVKNEAKNLASCMDRRSLSGCRRRRLGEHRCNPRYRQGVWSHLHTIRMERSFSE